MTIEELARIEGRLAWMHSSELADWDQRLRELASSVPTFAPDELAALQQSLEALRRALAFARDTYGKRLESLASPESMYTPEGCHDRLPDSQLKLSA